ncbi:Tf2-9, partial [Mucuna pruriens]
MGTRRADAKIQKTMHRLITNPQIYPLKKGKLVLPKNSSEIPLILQEFHATAREGLVEVFHIFKRIAGVFYWAGMMKTIKTFIAECHTCQTNKYQTLAPTRLLQPLPIPTQVWIDISMDFISGLPRSQGKDTILVVVDRLTKFHGFPTSILTDRNRLFLSQFWLELFKQAGTTLKYSSAYHPQANGQTKVATTYPSKVEAIHMLAEERNGILDELKKNLYKAQHRMKQADQKCRDIQFQQAEVGGPIGFTATIISNWTHCRLGTTTPPREDSKETWKFSSSGIAYQSLNTLGKLQ